MLLYLILIKFEKTPKKVVSFSERISKELFVKESRFVSGSVGQTITTGKSVLDSVTYVKVEVTDHSRKL